MLAGKGVCLMDRGEEHQACPPRLIRSLPFRRTTLYMQNEQPVVGNRVTGHLAKYDLDFHTLLLPKSQLPPGQGNNSALEARAVGAEKVCGPSRHLRKHRGRTRKHICL